MRSSGLDLMAQPRQGYYQNYGDGSITSLTKQSSNVGSRNVFKSRS